MSVRFCPFLLLAWSLYAGAVSVAIDTDAGSDDLMAIAFLLSRPDVRVESIQIVHGVAHVPRGAENVRKLLGLAGRRDVPVYLGREKPLQATAEFPAAWRKTSDELLSDYPPGSVEPARRNAVSYYKTFAASGKIVLALGPLTNLAAAVRAGARFNEIVLMGGAVRVPGNLGDGGYFKTANKTAEWNIFCDPEAADVVFRSGAAIRMVPLDATNEVRLDTRFLDEFKRSARSPLAVAVARLLERERQVIGQGIYYAWDPLAAVALIEPEVARWEDLPIRVRRDGTTEEAERAGVRVRVAVHADAARFRRVFLSALR